MACPRPVLASVLAAVLLAACGKKGPPLPPASRGPLPAAVVEARQHGDRMVVSFVLPGPRGAGAAVAIARAELVRVTYGPGGAPAADLDAFRRRGEVVAVRGDGTFEAGTSLRLVDRPPTGGEFAAGSTLRYGVRLFDQRGRISPLAMAPDLVVEEAALGPTGLRGEPTADGVRLSWEAVPGTRYNVYRAPRDEEVPLRPIHDRPVSAGEFLDVTAPSGARLVYTVRVVIGEPPPYIESADTAPLEIEVLDRFPPAPPRGLVAVQEGPAVRLFWDPSAERDLGGYRVYRRDASGEAWLRIGPDPIDRPLFRDDAVVAGQAFAYRLTAVDRATPANESGPSETVEIEIAGEPGASGEGEP